MRKSRAKPPGEPRQKRGRKPGNVKATALARQQAGGPPAHKDATKQVEIARRRARVLDLYTLQRMTCRQIADALAGEGITVTAKTVYYDLFATMEELKETRLARADQLREIELSRTEQADRAVLQGLYANKPTGPKGKGKDAPDPPTLPDMETRLKTHDRLMASVDRRAKLTGLYDDDRTGLYTADQVLGIMRLFMAGLMDVFTDPAAKQRILTVAEDVSRQLKPAGGGATAAAASQATA